MIDGTLSRRAFLGRGAVAGAASVSALHGAAGGHSGALSAANPARAASGKLATRRNLFNGDCNFFFYNPEIWQPEGGPYSIRAIHRHVAAIADGGIDTLLINPNTQVVYYPSRKLEYVLRDYRRGDRERVRRIAAGNAGLTPTQAETYATNMMRMFGLYLDLTDAGVDWLAEAAAESRRRGISPWLSYRMNPTHGTGAVDSPMVARLFREPRNRLSGRIPGPRVATNQGWMGMNFARPAVRDYMKAMIREGIEEYDYEGLEMDWLRHPVCLEPTASIRDTDLMTEWFAEIATMARARRADYAVGMRLPGNLAYLRAIGIDVKALVRKRVLDFVTFSNYWQTPWDMPFDELRRDLGPDVTIYGGMEDAPNWLEAHAPSLTERSVEQELQLAGDNAYFSRSEKETGARRIRGTRYLSASPEFMRANAAGKLVLGVAGIEQFNFFVTDQVRVPGQRAQYAALRGLADLEGLRGKEKHYALNTASLAPTKMWDQPEPLPARVAPGHRHALRLPMCAEPASADLRLIAQVVFARGDPAESCGVCFNGAWPVFGSEPTADLLFPSGPYTRHVDEHEARNYSLETSHIRDGWNDIVVVNESEREITIVALEVAVRK